MTDEKEIELKSVQVLKKTGLRVGYTMVERLEAGPVNKMYTVENDAEPNQEFQTALKLMIPHLLHICEISPVTVDAAYLKKRSAINDSALDKFRVTKVEVEGEGEDEVIVLHGKKFLKHGNVLEFKTPKIKMFGQEAVYEFSGNLHEDKENLFDCVEAYLGGAFTPCSQLEMQL